MMAPPKRPGPTSSGKTTFATKLTMYLRNLGLTGVALTVDQPSAMLNLLEPRTAALAR